MAAPGWDSATVRKPVRTLGQCAAASAAKIRTAPSNPRRVRESFRTAPQAWTLPRTADALERTSTTDSRKHDNFAN